MELHLEEYMYVEFIEIVCRLLKKKFNLDTNLSSKIGNAVWNKMKSKDVRHALNIAKLAKSSSDVDWLVEVQMKYSKDVKALKKVTVEGI
jgi:hypothetical protein